MVAPAHTHVPYTGPRYNTANWCSRRYVMHSWGAILWCRGLVYCRQWCAYSSTIVNPVTSPFKASLCTPGRHGRDAHVAGDNQRKPNTHEDGDDEQELHDYFVPGRPCCSEISTYSVSDCVGANHEALINQPGHHRPNRCAPIRKRPGNALYSQIKSADCTDLYYCVVPLYGMCGYWREHRGHCACIARRCPSTPCLSPLSHF